MTFFDDCDKILKIYYNHFLKGEKDKNGNEIWKELPKFEKICEQNLTIKDWGYIQAINHQLTSDEYLSSIAESNNKANKKHYVTPKGFAFFINGAYKQQVETEKNKLRLNWITANSALLACIIAIVLGSLQLWYNQQDNKLKDELNALKKTVLTIQSNQKKVVKQKQQNLFQQQSPKQISLEKLH